MSGEIVDVVIEDRDGVVIAQVTGELDIAGASSTGDAITQAVPTSARGLVVDFSSLDFIDSSGVAMLFGLARHLSGRRQQLRVVAPDGGPVGRVLDIVEFARAAPVVDDLETALGELS
ncbi:MAG TPA: STAS domain-containing protein [Thermoleophilaceae bacterium]|jgi:anti-anti-sigma factor